MALNEVPAGPSGAPQSKNRLLEGTKWVLQKIRDGLVAIFGEDPKMRAIIDQHLTPALIDRFREEHHRMVQERQEGAFDTSADVIREIQNEVSSNIVLSILRGIRDAIARFLHVLKAHGEGTREDIFDIVWKEVVPKELRNLPQPYLAEVVERLRRECGLRTA